MIETTEHRKWIKHCLEKARINDSVVTAQLVKRVFSTIQIWEREKADNALFRSQHDSLREIWRIAQEPDPPIRQIRTRLAALPTTSRNYLLRRARGTWPKTMLRKPRCDISVWAQRAPRERLLCRLLATIPEGGVIIPGRRRGESKQSGKRSEPVIMGVARGSGLEAPTGGRPSGTDEVGLIAYLAVDWALATGSFPEKGRSAETPFGDLVHHVFSWVTDASAEQALRRYWHDWEQSKNQNKRPVIPDTNS
jgi:hypothetical protein